MNTIEKLNQLAEFEAARDVLAMLKQDEINKILTPEIKAQVEAIDAEFSNKLAAADANISDLQAEIKAEVLATGATVKGAHYMAVYNKGRVTWDGKKLDGMMSIIPALADARKEGEPSITIRKA